MSTERLDKVLSEHKIPERHSFFQIKNFIIGKEPTPQAQLWKILRELKVRKENIASIELQIADSQDNLEEIEIRKAHIEIRSNATDEFAKKIEAINLRRIERQKKSIQNTISNLQEKLVYINEETEYLLNAFEAISKNNPFEAYDSPKVQKDYWNEFIAEELNLRAMLRQAPDLELIKTALSLDNDMPVKKKLIESFQSLQKENARIQNGK